jgi:hypothetical protein
MLISRLIIDTAYASVGLGKIMSMRPYWHYRFTMLCVVGVNLEIIKLLRKEKGTSGTHCASFSLINFGLIGV